MRNVAFIVLTLVWSFPSFGFAKDVSYIGSIQIVRGGQAAEMARGKVFLDSNRNSILDGNEKGIANVQVSNGREVVLTNAQGLQN